MKKRIFVLLISFVVILAGSIAAYAAFTFSLKSNVSTNNSSIDQNKNIQISDENTSENVLISVGTTGDDIHNLTFNNGTAKGLRFKLMLSTNVGPEELNLASGCMVYADDVFLGTLNNLDKKYLDTTWIVPASSSKQVQIKFHLHNDISNYQNLSFHLQIDSLVETLDTKEYSFVSNEAELKEAIQSVQSGMAKEIIFLQTITLTEPLKIQKKCKLNLYGHSFNGSITIEGDAVVDLLTTNGNTAYTNASIILNSENAFLNIDNSIVQFNSIDVQSFSVSSCVDLIQEKVTNGIKAGTSLEEILQNNSFYVPKLTVVDNEHVFSPSQMDQTYIGSVAINGTTLKIKVIGKSSVAVVEELLANEFSHIQFYAYAVDGIAKAGIELSSNLYLPTSIKQKNATILWESSNTDIMTNDGMIVEGTTGEIVLNAYIRVHDEIYKKSFKLIVIKQTKEMKLEYLASKIRLQLTKLWNESDPSTAISLPLVDSTSKIYGNVGEEQTQTFAELCSYLEIEEIWYSEDSRFGYLRITNTDQYLLGLKNVTFEKVAQINIFARFIGDKEESSAKVNVTIQLDEDNAFLEKIISYVQSEANNINVLQNILDTRKTDGILNERGDFELPVTYNGFTIEYNTEISENIIRLKAGSQNAFEVDATNFKTKEDNISIKCSVCLDNRNIGSGTITIKVPPAIHQDNSGFSNKTIFYSVKYQVLQQVLHAEGMEVVPAGQNAMDYLYNGGKGNYLLLDDIEKCETLYFQVGADTVSVDAQDYSIFEQLIAWATGSSQEAFPNATEELSSFQSDGTSGISPEEEYVILKMCSSFPYFDALWNKVVYMDSGYEIKNTLTNSQINELLAILGDQTYSQMIKWAEETDTTKIAALKDVLTTGSVDATIGNFKNDGLATVSYDEEEAIVRYCWSKGYDQFYPVWRTYIQYRKSELGAITLNDSLSDFSENTSNNGDNTAVTVPLSELLFSDASFFQQLKRWIRHSNKKDKKYTLSTWIQPAFLEFYGLSEYKDTSNEFYYYNILITRAEDRTSNQEKAILKKFFDTNFYSSKEDLSTVLNSTNNPLQTSEWNQLTNSISNGKGYFKANVDTTIVKSDIEKIISWATSETLSQTIDEVLLENPLSNTTNYYAGSKNDLTPSFSYAEYSVLKAYLLEHYLPLMDIGRTDDSGTVILTEEIAKNIISNLLSLYFNMEYSMNTLHKNEMYESLQIDTSDFENRIAVALNKTFILINGFVGDGLPTIGYDEYQQLITYIDTLESESKLELKNKLNEFLVYPMNGSEILKPQITQEILDKMKVYFDRITPEPQTEYDQFWYLQNSQIEDTDYFTGLQYFTHLNAIYMKGTSDKTFFVNPVKANQVLSYISFTLPEVKTIVMSYAGLSSIEGISQLKTQLERLDLAGNDLITSLSPLIKLDLSKMSHLNVSKIFDDEAFAYQFEVFSKIYHSSNVAEADKRFVYTFEGKDYFFSDTDVTALKLKAMQLAYLLKEIGTIWSGKMVLTNQVQWIENGSLVSYNIEWKIEEGPMVLKKASTYWTLERLSLEEGKGIISATITINDGTQDISYTRYFYVDLK